jgi:hypothetical protein
MKSTKAPALLLASMLAVVALLAPVAEAGIGATGIGATNNVPAATLLLPYFEVDMADANGVTTLLSINNASATAILAHVTVWTDLGVPTFAYNVYLTGYDVQTINVRDIFTGAVSRTASDGQDPSDTISPQGDFSQDINFASCTGQLPPPAVNADYLSHLQRSHTGQSSPFFGDKCSARSIDNVVRGYITVDTVNNCTLRVAGDPGYFGAGGSGDATNQNVLWGDYFFVNPAENFAQGDSLVHIEASSTDPETSVAGQYTFYGKYVGWNAADNREPLGAVWAARFLNGGAFTGGTSMISWRDSKVNQAPFSCGGSPAWYPLSSESLVAFDESENPENVSLESLPAASQKADVSLDLGVSPSFGWLYLNLNQANATAGSKPDEDPFAAQSFVSPVMDASGRFSVGFRGIQIESAAKSIHLCAGPCNP